MVEHEWALLQILRDVEVVDWAMDWSCPVLDAGAVAFDRDGGERSDPVLLCLPPSMSWLPMPILQIWEMAAAAAWVSDQEPRCTMRDLRSLVSALGTSNQVYGEQDWLSDEDYGRLAARLNDKAGFAYYCTAAILAAKSLTGKRAFAACELEDEGFVLTTAPLGESGIVDEGSFDGCAGEVLASGQEPRSALVAEESVVEVSEDHDGAHGVNAVRDAIAYCDEEDDRAQATYNMAQSLVLVKYSFVVPHNESDGDGHDGFGVEGGHGRYGPDASAHEAQLRYPMQRVRRRWGRRLR